MKDTKPKWLVCCLAACLLTGTALPQEGLATDRDAASTRRDTKSTQFFRSADLVGTNVRDSQGEKIGDIKELYLNPHNGVTFATIDISGSRDAVVPLQALKVTQGKGVLGTSKSEISVNKSKAELESGPTLGDNEWHKLDDASFTQQVFAAYNLQMPAAMGGAETPGGTSTDTTTTRDK